MANWDNRRILFLGDSLGDPTFSTINNHWGFGLFGQNHTTNAWAAMSGTRTSLMGGHCVYGGAVAGWTIRDLSYGAFSSLSTFGYTAGNLDLMIICIGANDEVEALPSGITRSTDPLDDDPATALQWFEDNIVIAANGGKWTTSPNAQTGMGNVQMPLPTRVLVVGQWAWRTATYGGIIDNVDTTHADVLNRLQAATTRIAALGHVEDAMYVEVASDAVNGVIGGTSTPGVNVAQHANSGGDATYCFTSGGDAIHMSAVGASNVWGPTVRYGIQTLMDDEDPDTPGHEDRWPSYRSTPGFFSFALPKDNSLADAMRATADDALATAGWNPSYMRLRRHATNNTEPAGAIVFQLPDGIEDYSGLILDCRPIISQNGPGAPWTATGLHPPAGTTWKLIPAAPTGGTEAGIFQSAHPTHSGGSAECPHSIYDHASAPSAVTWQTTTTTSTHVDEDSLAWAKGTMQTARPIHGPNLATHLQACLDAGKVGGQYVTLAYRGPDSTTDGNYFDFFASAGGYPPALLITTDPLPSSGTWVPRSIIVNL
jgi:hypothetical protein